MNKPTKASNRALDPGLNNAQHYFETELRLLWAEAVYSREAAVNWLT